MEGYTPPSIGQIGAIAKGTYTEITSVGGPDSADADDLVMIPVEVVNIWTDPFRIYCTGNLSTGEKFIDRSEVISPGETWYLSGLFYMPDQSVVVTIKSWYEVEGEFYEDDVKTKEILLAVEYQGTISRKELEYDGRRAGIPAY